MIKPDDIKKHTAEFFTSDPDFVLWCLDPERAQDGYWCGYTERHPQDLVEFERAVSLVRRVGKTHPALPSVEKQLLLDRILTDHYARRRFAAPPRRRNRTALFAAASLLVEGSVAIDVANGESVTLNPSERFSMKDGSYSVYEVDPYKYISWKDGLLFFTSNTLFEVLQKVAAFYKIEITCSGEIGSRKCTGKLILFDDLDGTLDVLSDIFRIAYVRGPDGSVAVRPAPDDCADAVYR